MPDKSPFRKLENINGFELRFGKFYDPNEYLNGPKLEIRILNKDPEMMHALYTKIREWLE